MEKTSVQQRLEIAKQSFQVGAKVCNTRIGSVGYIGGSPFFDTANQKIFLPVVYSNGSCFEDAECLIPISTVKKGHKKS